VSDLRENLILEFQNPDYRYAYAESFLNTKIATQIKILREQRHKKQAELGAVVGTKQSGFSRFEDVNHSVWKTDTLWKIARALDVRVNISFETFGSLIGDKERFNKEFLQRPDFEHDPAFNETAPEERMEPKRETMLVARIPTPKSGETARQELGKVVTIDQPRRYFNLGGVPSEDEQMVANQTQSRVGGMA
jgi:transcriptional regulator with XRE-family HTH domain